jgi:hypothetical protein
VPRTDALLATAALVLGFGLSACGAGSPAPAATGPSSAPASQGPGNALTVTDAHDRTYTLTPSHLTCAVDENDGHGVKVLQVQEYDRRERVRLDVLVVPVRRPTTFQIPISSGDSEIGPRNAYVFVGSKRFEASTSEELRHPARDRGRLTVFEATCDPARLRMTIDGRLGSELTGQEPFITGGVDLTAG